MTRWLLYAIAGDAELEFILGDLDEEFLEIAHSRGRLAARRWFARQVLRSIVPLLAMRIRSGELTHALAAGLLGAGLPLWLCDRLWSFLYSQVPLKDGTDREFWQLAVALLCLSAAALAAGSTSRGRQGTIAVSLSALLMTAAALAASTGAFPVCFALSALVLAPICASGRLWRRSK